MGHFVFNSLFKVLVFHYYPGFVLECLSWSHPLDSHTTNSNITHAHLVLNHLFFACFIRIYMGCHMPVFDYTAGFGGGCSCVGFRCRGRSRTRGRSAARSTRANRSPKSALYPEYAATLSNYPAPHLFRYLSP